MRLIDADALVEKLKKLYAMAFAEGDSVYHSAYRSLAKIVEDAPTIGEWTPVSERLPECSMDVFCYSDLGQMTGYYIPSTKQWFVIRPFIDDIEINVLAWMPLPKSYVSKGGE